MGESLMEGNGWFSGRVVRPPEVAVAMEREVRGRKKGGRKKDPRLKPYAPEGH
jgi:hypothetical protein